MSTHPDKPIDPTDPAPLASAEASLVTATADLANQLCREAELVFPAVFATARMIGLMELAAARCLEPVLEFGQRSVGVSVAIEHERPTPLGACVRARAQYLGLAGKLHRFEVVAEDDVGEIGRGEHTRVIVDSERLVNAAAKRVRRQ